MPPSEVEEVPLNLQDKAIIREMVRGQEITTRLKILLQEQYSSGVSPVRSLVDELLHSYSRALSVFDAGKVEECRRVVGSPSSETWGEKRKISSSKAPRGGHRRRRQAHAWTTSTSENIDDGHTWRKYGQKEIQHTKFPRSYFRCSHKYSQGCQALKQTQKSEDYPTKFTISYIGEHTCRDPYQSSHLINDSSDNDPCLIRFGPNPISSSLPSAMQEDEEILSNPTLGSSSSDYFSLQSLKGFQVSPRMAAVSGATSEHGEAKSDINSSTGSLENSFMAGSFGYDDDVFSFDQDDFFFFSL